MRLLAVFQGRYGHTRTSREGFIVDGAGEYLPWLTYPAIDFLRGLDYSGRRVLEFGAGSSTLFWAARASEVHSVELDARWLERLRPHAPANVRLHHEPDPARYAECVAPQLGRFDLIVIDGAERARCAAAALRRLAPGGAVVLDNADWYPGVADRLAGAGLIEMRFCGFSPLNAFTSTTSIFVSREFSFALSPAARRPPPGANVLPAVPPDDAPRP